MKIGPTYPRDQEKARIKKCIITLYPTVEVISDAVRDKVDLIFTYMKSADWTFNQIADEHYLKLKLILENRIYLYEIPKEWNAIKSGLIEILAEVLNLKVLDLFRITSETGDYSIIGRICQFGSQNSTLKNVLIMLKEKLGLPYLRYLGDEDSAVQRIAIIIGHPITPEILKLAKRDNINLLICDHFVFEMEKLAEELDLSLIDSTLYIVNLGLLKLSQALRMEQPNVQFNFINLKPSLKSFP
jgi:putative NIF3 family GTP cyclohydrolase 1 type 2